MGSSNFYYELLILFNIGGEIMQVCDKCKNELKGNSKVIIKEKTYDLCDYCIGEIEVYIKKGVKLKNFLQKMVGK